MCHGNVKIPTGTAVNPRRVVGTGHDSSQDDHILEPGIGGETLSELWGRGADFVNIQSFWRCFTISVLLIGGRKVEILSPTNLIVNQ